MSLTTCMQQSVNNTVEASQYIYYYRYYNSFSFWIVTNVFVHLSADANVRDLNLTRILHCIRNRICYMFIIEERAPNDSSKISFG